MGIPQEIKHEHVLKAVAALDEGKPHAFGRSVKFDLIYAGKHYAPKAVIALAAEYAKGASLKPSDFSSGVEPGQAVGYLRDLGFVVENKVEPLQFTVGRGYTKSDLYELLNVSEEKQGGDWNTGSHKHDDDWFIFANIGVPGRTGHDYDNHWHADELVWRGRTGTKISHPRIQSMLHPEGRVYIFTRSEDRAPYIYEGNGTAVKVLGTVPVTIHWSFEDDRDARQEIGADDVIASRRYIEGATRSISVNSYERNPAARRACIAHFGCICSVCGFDFEHTYGDLGKGFIHVHHLRDLATVSEAYEVDPIEDLRPVCPNCHAMLHRQKPAMSIEKLKMLLRL